MPVTQKITISIYDIIKDKRGNRKAETWKKAKY